MLKTCTMVVVALVISLGLVTQAFAITADGHLDEWGVALSSTMTSTGDYLHSGADAGWQATPPVTWQTGTDEDDTTTLGSGSGGEWYDIEGLYINMQFNSDRDRLTGIQWALVTSYNGYDHPGNQRQWWTANGAEWIPPAGAWAANSYRGQPVIAIDLNNDVPLIPDTLGTPGDRLHNWDMGLMLADDTEVAIPTTDAGLTQQMYTATLYNTQNAVWRGADNVAGFASIATLRPVDFDAASTPVIATQPTAGSWFGEAYETGDGVNLSNTKYTEDAKLSKPISYHQIYPNYWTQSKNYVWEGEIQLSGPGWYVGQIPTDWAPSITYGMWCMNDIGSGTGYGIPSVPEPASMALLGLATVAVGGAIKRRKKK